jgi:hypothetical protein
MADEGKVSRRQALKKVGSMSVIPFLPELGAGKWVASGLSPRPELSGSSGTISPSRAVPSRKNSSLRPRVTPGR